MPSRTSGPGRAGQDRTPAPLRFVLLASVEPRKGQDVFVRALAQLPAEIAAERRNLKSPGAFSILIFGRTWKPMADGDQKFVGHGRVQSRGSDREDARGGCGCVPVTRRSDADRDDFGGDESRAKPSSRRPSAARWKCSSRARTLARQAGSTGRARRCHSPLDRGSRLGR